MTTSSTTGRTSVDDGVPALLTYEAAGKILGVSDRTVWQLVKDRRLPAVRFRKSVRIDPADLRMFIDEAKDGQEPRRAS